MFEKFWSMFLIFMIIVAVMTTLTSRDNKIFASNQAYSYNNKNFK